MFCPKCSQPQTSDEIRFCPRCGFLLVGLKELVAAGGLSAALSSDPTTLEPSPRQRGIRQGARMIFWSVVMFPLFFGICFIPGSPAPLIVPATLFLIGLTLMIYARLFGESFLPPAWDRKADAQLGRHGNDFALPAAHTRPPAAALGPQHANTAEMIRPASVVDHTTNLLDRK